VSGRADWEVVVNTTNLNPRTNTLTTSRNSAFAHYLRDVNITFCDLSLSLDSSKKADREQLILRTSPFILEVSAVEKIILSEAFTIGYDKMSNNKVRKDVI
jgi:hypothetical protein